MYDLEDYSDLDTINRCLKIRKQCEEICNWMLNYKCSIRQCAEELCISKSTVHNYIHSYIKCYYDEEYCQIKRILQFNKQYRMRPRKYWKGRPR